MSSHLRQKVNHKTIIFFAVFTIFVIAYELFLWISSSTASSSPHSSAVHFLDVGQGDCALIVSGEDAILIDAGITAMGERVTQYLKEAGISRLTAAIGTHAHEDHIGGMAAVLRAFPTETLYLPDRLLRHTPTNPCWRLPRIWVQRYGFPLPDRFYSLAKTLL